MVQKSIQFLLHSFINFFKRDQNEYISLPGLYKNKESSLIKESSLGTVTSHTITTAKETFRQHRQCRPTKTIIISIIANLIEFSESQSSIKICTLIKIQDLEV